MTKIAAVLLLAVAGCGVAPMQDEPEVEFVFEPGDDTGKADGWTLLGSTTLQYEGTCEFLLNCSSWSTDRVVFGCSKDYKCVDDELWIAVPKSRKKAMCGETARICRKLKDGTTKCVNPVVQDVSCCNRFEASHGVLEALDVSHGADAEECSGYGEAKVNVYAAKD